MLINFVAMTSRHIALIFSVIFCMFFSFAGHSQEKNLKKGPLAVLVQLKAERNRTNALIKAQKYEDLELFRKDVNGTATAMIRDFKDHFNYCPVYFYSDTNFDAVMSGKFDGVLLDATLTPAKNIVIKDTGNNYLIVYYGYPAWQTKKHGKWDTTRAEQEGGNPNGKGLIINDYKLRQLSYIYRLDHDFFNFRKKNNKNPYKYESRKFDIEYSPCASEFNRKLKSMTKKRR
jgi:hypothetical protein